jgi:hypothetical protein
LETDSDPVRAEEEFPLPPDMIEVNRLSRWGASLGAAIGLFFGLVALSLFDDAIIRIFAIGKIQFLATSGGLGAATGGMLSMLIPLRLKRDQGLKP